MEEYQPRQSDGGEEAADMSDGGLAPEFAEQSEPEFVSESSHHGRNATMVLATLLMAGAGAVWFMRVKAGPASAAAAPTAQAASAEKMFNEVIQDGGQSLTSMRTMLKDTEKLVQEFLNYPSKKQVALEALQTNPFLFSTPTKASAEDAQANADKKRLEALAAEKQDLVKSVTRLELQSILAGGRVPTCMISGKTYTEGEQAGGHVIEKITTNGVVVRCTSQIAPENVYKFQLTMKR